MGDGARDFGVYVAPFGRKRVKVQRKRIKTAALRAGRIRQIVRVRKRARKLFLTECWPASTFGLP
eukprot:490958-Lingulodinium_polyedra.AAC.1